ncbi:MAG: CDP-diacylglycerol--glycerol-3-phosphate 3-phosphatidyltransferase, partial [Thermotoga sp.]
SADKLGKSKTVSQIVVIVYILSVASIFKGYPGVFGIILIWISFLLTILSGLNYVISGFRILKGE